MTRSLMLLGLVGSIVFTLTAVAPADARTATSTVTVEATGEAALQGDAAAARAEAIWSAKRNAVEEAGGLLLRAVTDASHYRIVRQETSATVQGFIRSWSLVPGSVTVKQLEPPLQGQVICVQIEAVVDIQPLAHSMAELQDVYNDLNRPSLWVDVKSTSQSATAARTDVDVNLTSWLKSNGFNIAAHEHDADVVLHVELLPVWKIRMGGSNTPYDLGAQVSSCSLDLTWQALETSSQMVLESGAQHEQATSFSSNAAAASKASRRAVIKLEANPYIITTLLARWTAERYSGYVASIQVVGLPARLQTNLEHEISQLRGFMGVRDRQSRDGVYTIHARFRQSLISLNASIAALHPGANFQMRPLERRGSLMLFRANKL